MKKWFITALIFFMIMPMLSSVVDAKETQISIMLDNVPLETDLAPYIIPKVNVTMVPLRVISEGIGAKVSWSQSARTVTITKDGDQLALTKGNKTASVNNQIVPLDASVDIKNGRIVVPIRFVSENLGLKVLWSQGDQRITLLSQGAIIPETPLPVQPVIPPTTNSTLRGAWISTVYNLDWPSAASTGKEAQQKAEYIAMLDKLQAMGMNAVFVQVRPSGDALYSSTIVPWSKVLTGKQGQHPGYDPLEFMIEETHRRGMSFHAWFNPFRANMDTKTAGLANNHVAVNHPEWIVNSGTQLIINPGIPDARQHVIDVIMEVVQNYKIDGVHLDDYFYPTSGTFNDDNTFKLYNSKGIKNKGDWRRDNVNQFIEQLGKSIDRIKPEVEFGVSPFGVWRNKASDITGSDTKAGITSYDSYYADTRVWIKNEWIDYIAPQIYWSMTFNNARYDKLVDWWVNEVQGTKVDLYIGQAAYKVGTPEIGWQNTQEITDQLTYNAKYNEVKGSIFFRAGLMLKNPLGLIEVVSSYYNQS